MLLGFSKSEITTCAVEAIEKIRAKSKEQECERTPSEQGTSVTSDHTDVMKTVDAHPQLSQNRKKRKRRENGRLAPRTLDQARLDELHAVREQRLGERVPRQRRTHRRTAAAPAGTPSAASTVTLCLSAERYADAILLGGPALLQRTQQTYFEKRMIAFAVEGDGGGEKFCH
ncbi:hypothetical protein DFH11DRAFT_1751194 [Phellopilus nigrolimitatus]|nr:hypothetical protein DFH11DRAFT_1751194 [Phellopilus nigrolimitatus]